MGVLSVDAGQNGVINVVKLNIKNSFTTGYGKFCYRTCNKEIIYGTTFEVGTYPVYTSGGCFCLFFLGGIVHMTLFNEK
jgi:hypothetical protein